MKLRRVENCTFCDQKTAQLKRILAIIASLLLLMSVASGQHRYSTGLKELIDRYVNAWKVFYPSAAFAAGDKASAFGFEDFSGAAVGRWIAANRSVLQSLDTIRIEQSFDERVDARLLRRQAETEIELWSSDSASARSPQIYAETISQALTYVVARNVLNGTEKAGAALKRMAGIRHLCGTGVRTLDNCRPDGAVRCVGNLLESARFLRDQLPGVIHSWSSQIPSDSIITLCKATADSVRGLAAAIKEHVIPASTLRDAYGAGEYRRKLRIYTCGMYTPEAMREIAHEEIKDVQHLMSQLAPMCWRKLHPRQKLPSDPEQVLSGALIAMEQERAVNQEQFVDFYKRTAAATEKFVRLHHIATMPTMPALVVETSPAFFSGAAIGGVYPPGPFRPNDEILYFVPTVSDSAPSQAKEAFYRSFNTPFNTMIMAHEIYPGHSLQITLAAGNPHIVRSLFADESYVEGWASLCEQIMLDNGWGHGDPLNRMAHLRKRLENAVRAFVSVMVHCEQWDQQELSTFAVNEGHLAPQFVVNLWNRAIDTPMQITSYFLGFHQLNHLLNAQEKRMGKRFTHQSFCDAVIAAGAVPIDELPGLFASAGQH